MKARPRFLYSSERSNWVWVVMGRSLGPATAARTAEQDKIDAFNKKTKDGILIYNGSGAVWEFGVSGSLGGLKVCPVTYKTSTKDYVIGEPAKFASDDATVRLSNVLGEIYILPAGKDYNYQVYLKDGNGKRINLTISPGIDPTDPKHKRKVPKLGLTMDSYRDVMRQSEKQKKPALEFSDSKLTSRLCIRIDELKD